MARLHSSFAILMVLLLLQGCMAGNRYTYGYYTGKTPPSVPTDANVHYFPQRSETVHVVIKGETLYSIAFACGEDVRTVAAWNHIRPPYTIYPGQSVRLTPPPVTHRPRVHTVNKRAITTTANIPTKKYSARQTIRKWKATNTQKISWQWPTKGMIIGTYAAKDTGKKGLDIAGKIGQPIYAAASGLVVYSGSGLRGYGKLIIIKHNDTYFTAYAHNHRLLVKEDQKVKKGQHIADMGITEADRPSLHFEVRRDGKPVDPLQYLPKRR